MKACSDAQTNEGSKYTIEPTCNHGDTPHLFIYLLMCLSQADDLGQPMTVVYWTIEHILNSCCVILIYSCLLGKQMAARQANG